MKGMEHHVRHNGNQIQVSPLSAFSAVMFPSGFSFELSKRRKRLISLQSVLRNGSYPVRWHELVHLVLVAG